MDKFIKVYSKIYSDEFCDKVIEYHKLSEETGLILDRQSHDGAHRIDKQDLSTFLPHVPLHHTSKELITEFNELFWAKAYKQYVESFDILRTVAEHRIYSMKIQKTEPGQGYHVWHCEASDRAMSTRLLTWTVYLNDDFEAGETEFLYQQYRYKPQKGDLIIFPSAYTHTHRGNPPIGGTKYIITGWVEY